MISLNLSSSFKYHALVIGVSSGAIHTLEKLLPHIQASCPVPVIITMHIGKHPLFEILDYFAEKCDIPVQEAQTDMPVEGGKIYFAPPDYHLLVEPEGTFSLSSDEEVCFSRPSIDVLFESAAMVYRKHLIGLILSGANKDGTSGMQEITKWGGLALVQDPADAISPEMPNAVLQNVEPVHTLTTEDLKAFFGSLHLFTASKELMLSNDSPCTNYS